MAVAEHTEATAARAGVARDRGEAGDRAGSARVRPGGVPPIRRAREAAIALVRDPAVQQAVALVVGLRVVLGLIAWGSLEVMPASVVGGDWVSLVTPNGDRLAPLVAPWQRWDGLWYQHIATSGYSHGGVEAAFFPLYPGLMHVAGAALGGAYALGGLLVSTVALAVALVLFHRLVAGDFDRGTADRAVLYIALAPTAFFFLAPFSESLFLALSVGCILAARRRHWWIAGAVGLLAALCRVQGLLLVAPILLEVIAEARTRMRHGARRGGLRGAHAFALLPAAGTILYLTWASVALEISPLDAAQTRWRQHVVAPWTALHDSLSTVIAGAHPEEPLNLIVAVLAIVAVPLMIRRVPWSYVAYAAVMLIPLCCRESFFTPLSSTARYAAVDIPLFVLLATAGRRVWVDRVVLATFPVVMSFELVSFTHFHFVG